MLTLRLAAAQLDTVVGDLAGNVAQILGGLRDAEAAELRRLRTELEEAERRWRAGEEPTGGESEPG